LGVAYGEDPSGLEEGGKSDEGSDDVELCGRGEGGSRAQRRIGISSKGSLGEVRHVWGLSFIVSSEKVE
jgi:hypothetical protein